MCVRARARVCVCVCLCVCVRDDDDDDDVILVCIAFVCALGCKKNFIRWGSVEMSIIIYQILSLVLLVAF